jgi:hypothetical protein
MEIVNVMAILLSPVIAVLVTLWHQRRTVKRDAMHRLFITLMAHRKTILPDAEWVSALNVIDVEFAGHKEVLNCWHSYYDAVSESPMNNQKVNHCYIELMTAMAQALGYEHLKQTDIDKFYSPMSFGDQLTSSKKLQTELIRVLESTESLVVNKRKAPQPKPAAK